MSVNGPISPKQCYHEIDYSFYSFYWLDSLEIRLDHNSTYYRSLSKNSDVKRRISHCDSQNLQYKTHPEFWPSHRRIFKTGLYYKTRLILETRRYIYIALSNMSWQHPNDNSNMTILILHQLILVSGSYKRRSIKLEKYSESTLKECIKINSGGFININMLSYPYRHSHYKDKMVSWLSYLYNGNPYTEEDCLIETGPCLFVPYLHQPQHSWQSQQCVYQAEKVSVWSEGLLRLGCLPLQEKRIFWLIQARIITDPISMGYCKKDLTP